MATEIIKTDAAPAAIGPYSQAIKTGGMVFTSGQIPLDPASGAIVAGGIAEQATRVMENLQTVLEAAGSSMSQLVKTTVFIADMNDFAEFNEIYATFVGEAIPARSCVEAARLPKDVKVEVEAIALVG